MERQDKTRAGPESLMAEWIECMFIWHQVDKVIRTSSTSQPFPQMMCHDHLSMTEKWESVVAADVNKSMRFIRATGTIITEWMVILQQSSLKSSQ